MDLHGRAAFVTGGSGDLGAAACEALARAGCDVAVGYVGNRDGAAKTVRLVEGLGRRACAVQLDQAEAGAIDGAVARAAGELGRLDVLVNNAAWNIGIPFPELEALTVEIWDRIFDTNVRGPFQLARAAAAHMKKTGAGRIVNVASVAGLKPDGSSIAYAASKAALIHLTRCLAVALAPSITVNCVAPGLIEGTRMAQRLPQPVTERACAGGAPPHLQRGRHRRADRDVLPRGQRHRPGRSDRRRRVLPLRRRAEAIETVLRIVREVYAELTARPSPPGCDR